VRAALREDPILFLLTLAAAATSIAALLLHLAGVVRMPYTLSFLTVPGMVFLLCVRLWARRSGRTQILGRLEAGFVAGLLGLVVYNAARWVVGTALAVKSSPFYSINIFGSLITGESGDSAAAIGFGWAYHVSNGITFGIIYALIAGPARWWWGLGWGLILELAMLLIYPSSAILRPPSLAPFVATSLISHALFGAVIGIYTRWRLL
jgi:hypothetical protein